jgi:hypothetical protein
MRRVLFTALAGALMLYGVATPTVPVVWPLAIAAALVTSRVAWLLWSYIEDQSRIDALIDAARLHPNRQVDHDDRIFRNANRAQVRL